MVSQWGPEKKIYTDEKDRKKKQHIWEYKDAQYPSSPTGKNLHIIRFVIMTSSNPGDLELIVFMVQVLHYKLLKDLAEIGLELINRRKRQESQKRLPKIEKD